MPFLDSNKEVSFGSTEFDFTIVGAGAAGISTAVNLSKRGYKILLIESGHFEIDEDLQKLNEVVETGKMMGGISWGRKRAIGGTTLAWGGQSLPFSPLDFEKRGWVYKSGWPIRFNELLSYYKRANEFMGIDTLAYEGNAIFNKIKLVDPGIEKKIFNYHVSKWAKQPNFKSLYEGYLEKNVTVLYNAVLQKAIKRFNDVVAIEIVNHKGITTRIGVNTLIITAGGIETNRIMLSNPDLFETSKNYELVGKGFMDHPCLTIGEIITNNPYKLQQYFNTHHIKGNKISIRLSLSQECQVKNHLLNSSGSILFIPKENQFDPYAEIKSFSKDFSLRRLLKLSGSFSNITKSAYAYFKSKFFYKVDAIAQIVLMLEQEPIETSFIKLSDEKDSLGHNKAIVNWDISGLTWKTAVYTAKYLKYELERLKFGNVDLNSSIEEKNMDWKNLLSDVNHHMGGCPMSDSPQTGVVNKNLKLWGVNNTFLCSCAVFPTSSHSNPTLTLLALCERLTDFLSNEKNKGNS